MEILLFMLGVVGMTHMIVDASIFSWLRNLIDNYLPKKIAAGIHCYQCTGFWCGLLCGWMVLYVGTWWLYFIPLPESPLQVFVAGCAGSVLANFMAIYMNYLEARTIITLDNNKNGD